MKYFIIFLMFFFSIFTHIAYSEECSKHYLSLDLPIISIIEQNKEILEITLEQEEAIIAIKQEFEPMIQERKKEIDKLEEKLKSLVLNGGSSKDIKEIIIKLAQLKAENTILRIKEIRNIQNSLTEVQYEKVLKMLNQQPI